MHSSHTNHETAYSGDPNSHTSLVSARPGAGRTLEMPATTTTPAPDHRPKGRPLGTYRSASGAERRLWQAALVEHTRARVAVDVPATALALATEKT
jgi:hypothetical protein